MRTDPQGRGYVSILAADQLVQRPKLYASCLLWLLAELFEDLPEVGDLPKPKPGFFFDEAHLLFDDAPDVPLETVEQVVRRLRSKGVGGRSEGQRGGKGWVSQGRCGWAPE